MSAGNDRFSNRPTFDFLRAKEVELVRSVAGGASANDERRRIQRRSGGRCDAGQTHLCGGTPRVTCGSAPGWSLHAHSALPLLGRGVGGRQVYSFPRVTCLPVGLRNPSGKSIPLLIAL